MWDMCEASSLKMPANCSLIGSSYFLFIIALTGCMMIHLLISHRTFTSHSGPSSRRTISGRAYDVIRGGMRDYNFSDTKHEPDADGNVNPHPFEYIITPRDSTCGNDEAVYLFAYVHSAPQHKNRRSLIRHTWANVSLSTAIVKTVFVMGRPSSSAPENCQAAIEQESIVHGDIIQEDFIDTYRNLTFKAVAAMRWITTNCFRKSHDNSSFLVGPRYVLKTDDDAFVDIFAVLRYLQHRDTVVRKQEASSSLLSSPEGYTTNATTPGIIMCSFHPKRLVSRSGKWKSTLSERRHKLWPPFCLGLAYLLTGNLVPDLYRSSFDVPFLWLDDVYVTGFLPLHIGPEAIKHVALNGAYVGQLKLEERMADLVAKIENGGHGRWQSFASRNPGVSPLVPMFSHMNNLQLYASVWKDLLIVERWRNIPEIHDVSGDGIPSRKVSKHRKISKRRF